MADQKMSEAEVNRHLAAVLAAQHMAGEEPTAEDMEAARRILMGEATAEQEIAARFAQIDAKYGITRPPPAESETAAPTLLYVDPSEQAEVDWAWEEEIDRLHRDRWGGEVPRGGRA